MRSRSCRRGGCEGFRRILDEVRDSSARALQEKAVTANRIAKIASRPIDRIRAYRVKTAVLNRGIELGFFAPRSDEEGRAHLMRVTCGVRRTLHMPIRELSASSAKQARVRALLGRGFRDAA